MSDEFATACEQAELYAAGLLTDEEAVAFEAHVATGCAGCEDVARRTAGAVAAIGLSADAEPLPAALRERILESARAEVPARTPSAVPSVTYVLAGEGDWEATELPGVEFKRLFVDEAAGRKSYLMRLAAQTRYPSHRHDAIEELVLVSGDVRIGNRDFRPGDYARAEPGSTHEEHYSENGCIALVILTSSLSA